MDTLLVRVGVGSPDCVTDTVEEADSVMEKVPLRESVEAREGVGAEV